MIRQEIIAALRAEADRLEAGGDYEVSYTIGPESPIELHSDPDFAHDEARRILSEYGYNDYDQIWHDDVNQFEWGYVVPVRRAVMVDVEAVCACRGSGIDYKCDYSFENILTHAPEPEPERLESCEDCSVSTTQMSSTSSKGLICQQKS